MLTRRAIDHLFSKMSMSLPERLSEKDKARVITINFFGLIISAICISYSLVFYFLNDSYLLFTSLSVGLVCIIPPALNYFKKFEISRVLYLFQAPIFVLIFSNVLGPGLNVQYFFVLLYVFPFVILRPNEPRSIRVFFVYNTICLILSEFFPIQFLDHAYFSETVYVLLKVTVLSMLILMAFVVYFAFQHIIIRDEELLVNTRFEREKASQVKNEFLATMSHELRTPLNAVVTITNILEENPDHKDRYAFVRLLNQSSNNLLSIINDILDFSQLESNKVKLELRTQDFRQVLNNIGNTYRGLAADKDLKFVLNVDHQLARYYKVDDVKLAQILGNLITNAIKFTARGEVLVNVKKEKSEGYFDTVLFEVSDTGQGMNASELGQIFESFTQIKSVITRNTGGTGLGLAIVKRLLHLYHSDIIAESAPGMGSKFYFKLKLKTSDDTGLLKNKKYAHILNKRVLLVEDNKVNALVAEKLLENWGLIIDIANNGQIALDKCSQEKYDLILMDLHMPVMDGYETARIIRETETANRRIPIYALTADVTGENTEGFDRYFDGFFTKPIQKDRLQNVLVTRLSKN